MSLRSKDPSTRHGAVIVDENNRIISTGYNGFPRSINDDSLSWGKPEKYQYVIHAELNAILNSNKNLTNSTLYLYSEKDYLPCSHCAATIIQQGITTVVVNKFPKYDTDQYQWGITTKLFQLSGVTIRSCNFSFDFNGLEKKIFSDLQIENLPSGS